MLHFLALGFYVYEPIDETNDTYRLCRLLSAFLRDRSAQMSASLMPLTREVSGIRLGKERLSKVRYTVPVPIGA